MYHVVGCSNCDAIWIVEDKHDSTTCRRCRKQHQLDSLKKFVTTEDKRVATEFRSKKLAERAGYGDEFDPDPELFS